MRLRIQFGRRVVSHGVYFLKFYEESTFKEYSPLLVVVDVSCHPMLYRGVSAIQFTDAVTGNLQLQNSCTRYLVVQPLGPDLDDTLELHYFKARTQS
jgi:hypothetical protein